MGEVERSKEVSDRLQPPACAHWKGGRQNWKQLLNWEQFFQPSSNRHPKAKEEEEEEKNKQHL